MHPVGAARLDRMRGRVGAPDRPPYDVTLYCLWQSTWLDAPAIPERIRMKVKLDKHANRWTAAPFYCEWLDGTAYVLIIDPASYGDMVGVRLGIVPIPWARRVTG